MTCGLQSHVTLAYDHVTFVHEDSLISILKSCDFYKTV